jgi:hypothetical protein
MTLHDAATVTLCWHRKASHFWIMLLLVSGTADHGMIQHPARSIPACNVGWSGSSLDGKARTTGGIDQVGRFELRGRTRSLCLNSYRVS